MKKVLIIANQFPPMGGSGVQRTAKFVKYLPKFNYDPIVFTIKETQAVKDHSMIQDIESTDVLRTKPYSIDQMSGILGILGKIFSRKFLIPDPEWLWYIMSRKKALQYVKDHNIDLIYSTSYPYSDHLMAYFIKKRIDVKWVVDFRDEWTNNPYIIDKNYSVLRRKIERFMEKKVVTTCDRFITNTPLMLRDFIKDYDIEHKSYVISNGYDTSDFDDLDRSLPSNERMIFTYSGSIYGRRNKIEIFFKVLRKAIEKGKINPNKIQVRIIGNFVPKLVQHMQSVFPYNDVLEFIPYLPHKESIKKLLESDVLLFYIGSGLGAEKIYTGKIFEYFYANRPLLSLVPRGSIAGKIIEETKTGYNCLNDDPKDIYKTLIDMYQRWEKGELVHSPDWHEIAKYDRVHLTEQLAKVFDDAYNER